ncbi:uncharacterized protein G2W53_008203 [Senna tora]|uniref:Uncharacterized protein n=1 Tax=Senna tora TaxID=362788 RepID=A0A834X7F7_9FABA|nr:uncharacterized protein G2W53_008203 [Senna tora]
MLVTNGGGRCVHGIDGGRKRRRWSDVVDGGEGLGLGHGLERWERWRGEEDDMGMRARWRACGSPAFLPRTRHNRATEKHNCLLSHIYAHESSAHRQHLTFKKSLYDKALKLSDSLPFTVALTTFTLGAFPNKQTMWTLTSAKETVQTRILGPGCAMYSDQSGAWATPPDCCRRATAGGAARVAAGSAHGNHANGMNNNVKFIKGNNDISFLSATVGLTVLSMVN